MRIVFFSLLVTLFGALFFFFFFYLPRLAKTSQNLHSSIQGYCIDFMFAGGVSFSQFFLFCLFSCLSSRWVFVRIDRDVGGSWHTNLDCMKKNKRSISTGLVLDGHQDYSHEHDDGLGVAGVCCG